MLAQGFLPTGGNWTQSETMMSLVRQTFPHYAWMGKLSLFQSFQVYSEITTFPTFLTKTRKPNLPVMKVKL